MMAPTVVQAPPGPMASLVSGDLPLSSLSSRRARVTGKPAGQTQLYLAFADPSPVALEPTPAERWLPIPGYPGYEVSDWGRVHSYRINRTNSKDPNKPRIGSIPRIIGGTQRSGHILVNLQGMGPNETRAAGVHVLVLEMFVGPCPPGCEACHKDGNPGNNHVSNLYWGTRSENIRDAFRHGTSNKAKLLVADIPRIWERLVAGESSSSISRIYGVCQASIVNIRTGHTWSHITANLPGWPLVDVDRNKREPVRIPQEFCKTEEEIWRILPDWPAYQVSNFGRVQSLWKHCGRNSWRLSTEWKEIYPNVNKAGRPQFYVSNGSGKTNTLHVHVSVLTAFAGQAPPGMIACHDDDNPLNNRASNLRWDTYAANARDRVNNSKKKSCLVNSQDLNMEIRSLLEC